MKLYFKNIDLNYVPIVEAILRNPIGHKSLSLELIIDTGFQGGVLIPFRNYLDLELNLFEEPKVIARTSVGGEIELRVSKVFIEFNNFKILCHAYTTLGVRRALLGREVLQRVGLLYKPPNELKLGLDIDKKAMENRI